MANQKKTLDLFPLIEAAQQSIESIILGVINTDELEEPLSVLEWYILRVLYSQEGDHAIGPTEIAREVNRTATSFTPILDKLQDKGLIERKAVPNDRRRVAIYLTDKGEARRDKTEQEVKKIAVRITKILSFDEQWDLQQSLEKIIAK